jgi:DNA polymerase III subunit epsilon
MRDPLQQTLLILDLETTGADPTRDRITEIGAIRVENGVVVERWQSLVNPERSIPVEIQALTGISNEMVRDAPRFNALVPTLQRLSEGAIFVAHNARFDYGFIKNEFLRLEQAYTADVLCTVRLSRRLAPEHPSHSLDTLVERFALEAQDRHRAMGDAQLVVQLLAALVQTFGAEPVRAAASTILKIPSLPSHLPADALDGIPDCPGVYLFYGVNSLPLYIGKSINLRDRVRSHFSSDYRQANDARLATELRRIEFQTTAGEFGALLLETVWIRERLPLLNKAKRKIEKLAVLQFDDLNAVPKVRELETFEPQDLAGKFGPFTNAASARRTLRALASANNLCWKTLGLEQRDGPCFGRQVRKCSGCCVGEETLLQHQLRVLEVLAPLKIPSWPFSGAAVLKETCTPTIAAPQRQNQAYWFDHWRLLGQSAWGQAEPPPTPQLSRSNQVNFDMAIFKLLRKHLQQLVPSDHSIGE